MICATMVNTQTDRVRLVILLAQLSGWTKRYWQFLHQFGKYYRPHQRSMPYLQLLPEPFDRCLICKSNVIR